MKFVSAAHLTGGGTITGDLTISGDLSVEGAGSFTYDEMVAGDMIIDQDFTGTTTATTKGLFVDFDATGITASGQTATNIGLDLDMNSDSPTMVGTVNNTGLDLDVVGGTSGTTKNIGIDVSVSGADTNYAALFNGGNVGIGTSSPTSELNLRAANPILIWEDSSVSALHGQINVNGNYLNIRSMPNDKSSATERLSVDLSTGNVGIGTSSPDSLLHLEASTPILTFKDSDTSGVNFGGGIEFKDSAGVKRYSMSLVSGDAHLDMQSAAKKIKTYNC
jgi:hypothetical protein